VTIKSLLKELIGVNNVKVKSWELITSSKNIKELYVHVDHYNRDQKTNAQFVVKEYQYMT